MNLVLVFNNEEKKAKDRSMRLYPSIPAVHSFAYLSTSSSQKARTHSQTPNKSMDPSATWRDVFLAVLALYLLPLLAVGLLWK